MTLRAPTPSRLRGSPDRNAGFFRMRATNGASALRSGPRVRGGQQDEFFHLPKEVTPGLISQVGVTFSATTNSKTLFFNLIDNSGQLFRPTLPYTVTAQQISNLGVLFNFVIPTAHRQTFPAKRLEEY